MRCFSGKQQGRMMETRRRYGRTLSAYAASTPCQVLSKLIAAHGTEGDVAHGASRRGRGRQRSKREGKTGGGRKGCCVRRAAERRGEERTGIPGGRLGGGGGAGSREEAAAGGGEGGGGQSHLSG
eukprot:143474-Rhodomonas_salina.5